MTLGDYFEQGEYHALIIILNNAISTHPTMGELYYFRGLAKYFLNDIPGSGADFIQAQKNGYTKDPNFIRWQTSIPYKVKIMSESYVKPKDLKPENNYKPVYTRKDSLQGALRPERTCYDVNFYDLHLKIMPQQQSIEGSNTLHFTTVASTRRIQIDLAEKLKIQSIVWNGQSLPFSRSFNAVFVDFPEVLAPGASHAITVKYAGKPRVAPSPPWNGGFVWKKNKESWWVGVACEHLGASSWWPCKDHLTEKPDSMRITIGVPEGYQAVANGNLRSTQPAGDQYVDYEWFVSYPINSYCVTFYMGKFVNFNEVYTNASGSFAIDYYVMEHSLDSAKAYYSQTKDIVRVYEKYFGEYPYPRDGMGMVEAPYAGMEHQGAIAIGDEYGSRKRRPYDEIGYDYLLVHETAHEWWGNTVTMGDMADAWISESFATYAEHIFMLDLYGEDEYLNVVSKNMGEIMNLWPMVGNRDVNDNTFLGGDIYKKGAAMLHSLRCELNDDSLFFGLIKGFFTARKFKTTTTLDFITFVNTETGRDYTDFFKKYLYDKTPPVLEYDFALKDGELQFAYHWVNVGKNFRMPFGLVINNEEGIRLEGTTDVQVFELEDVKRFYIVTEKRYEKGLPAANSLTYFWTFWNR